MKPQSSADAVHQPAHYQAGRFGCQAIEFTRRMTGPPSNVFKYVFRHEDKGGAEDLRKALVYLGWAIEDGTRPVVEPEWETGLAVLYAAHVVPYLPAVDPVYAALGWLLDGQYARVKSLILARLAEYEREAELAGPWPTLLEVPPAVPSVLDRDTHLWVRDENHDWLSPDRGHDCTVSLATTAPCITGHRSYGPFTPRVSSWPSLLKVPDTVTEVRDADGGAWERTDFGWSLRGGGHLCGFGISVPGACAVGHPRLSPFTLVKVEEQP